MILGNTLKKTKKMTISDTNGQKHCRLASLGAVAMLCVSCSTGLLHLAPRAQTHEPVNSHNASAETQCKRSNLIKSKRKTPTLLRECIFFGLIVQKCNLIYFVFGA
jgi:hypothetical protein